MFFSEDAAVNIAKAYYGPYAAKYDEGNGISNSNWTGGVSVCALRTEPLADLAVLTKQILPERLIMHHFVIQYLIMINVVALMDIRMDM